MLSTVKSSHTIINAVMLRELRLARRESQTKFWQRFGVTQSRGSRFEMGFDMPPSIIILVQLYLDGTVSDKDLWRARQNDQPYTRAAQYAY